MEKEINYLMLPAKKNGGWQAVIEIPRGERKKKAVTHSNPSGLKYERKVKHPFRYAYGFIPGTIAGDGECVDVYVLGKKFKELDVVEINIIGMIKATDNGKEDNKIIACLANCKCLTRCQRRTVKRLCEIMEQQQDKYCGKEQTERYLNRHVWRTSKRNNNEYLTEYTS